MFGEGDMVSVPLLDFGVMCVGDAGVCLLEGDLGGVVLLAFF